ncbi:ankyrin repeat domain-containing protein [Croceicoccus sp. BE223]|uniref:ankyrin repeat domain-containing protein n=1 Tax=Croceicoccus sp. BE223 TaxID=2817716 RepID=UPI0028675312|nr:ankyrin repeat domain-containing protein [Croceicoccus sp. BE223]MDR7103826.1 ankyrin repeat protein [Croceicoccus sp. BE223]
MVAAAGASVLTAVPASAQFSDGYKFIEAVKKRDGEAVTKALGEPGSTIVNTRDISSGQTALHVVVQRRDLVWVRFLLQANANPNVRDNDGMTPLELAASLRFIEGIEALADAGANVDEPNSTGETALILATHLKDADMAKVLLEKGANPDKADNSGRSARDYAKIDGQRGPVLTLIENLDKVRGNGGTYGPAVR